MSRWGSNNKYSKLTIANNFVPWKHGHIVVTELSRAQLCQQQYRAPSFQESRIGLGQGCKFDNRLFERIASFLWSKEQKSNSLMKKSELLRCSFLKIDGIDSLTEALFQRAKGAIHSWLLFCKEQQEPIDHVDL